MFKAVKECLKNWLIAHERLYWYIVIGLAVFGFGLVTAMGMAKLEKANAAENLDISMFYSDMQSYRDLSYKNYAYVSFVLYDKKEIYALDRVYMHNMYLIETNDETNVIPFILDDGTGPSKIEGSLIIPAPYKVIDESYGYRLLSQVASASPRASDRYECYITLIDGNMNFPDFCVSDDYFKYQDIRTSGGSSSISYDFSVPYVVYKGVLNKRRFNDFGEIVTGSMWNTRFFIDYNKPFPADLTQGNLHCSVTYAFPSASMVKGWIDNGKTVADICTESRLKAWYPLLGVENFDTNILYNAEVEVKPFEQIADYRGEWSCNYQFYINTLDSLISINELYDGGWEKPYKEVLTDEEWGCWRDAVLYYMTPIHIQSIQHAFNMDGKEIYGDLSGASFIKEEIEDFADNILYTYSSMGDYAQMTDEERENIIDNGVNSAIENNQSVIDNLEAQLESVNQELDALRNSWESSDSLFGVFTGLAKGIQGATSGFRSFAVAVGNVFSFLPSEVLTVMSFTFIALLVIAVYKALRG